MLPSIRLTAAGYILVAAACAPALAEQPLPGIKRDLAFDALMKTIDLEDPSLRLLFKKPTPDGSSVGMHIAKGDNPPGASFVPTNSSSIPEAEVVSYRLAQFLGVSRNYYPVDYYKLGPKTTAKFRDMVVNTRVTEDDSVLNRNMVLKQLKDNPELILGIYRLKPKMKMYAARSLGTEGQFNLKSSLARAIRASGPMPDDEPMPLEGVKGGRPEFPALPTERKVELARQLSTIFVIDQLIGQWDRFWENMEATGDKNGRLKLVARDNGGATLDDWEEFETYNRWVSRFDRDVVGRLTALNAFLKGDVKEFSGFTSPQDWKTAAGFMVDASYDAFCGKLARLIEKRIPAIVDEHGDEAFLPAKSPDIIKKDDADTGEDD